MTKLRTFNTFVCWGKGTIAGWLVVGMKVWLGAAEQAALAAAAAMDWLMLRCLRALLLSPGVIAERACREPGPSN